MRRLTQHERRPAAPRARHRAGPGVRSGPARLDRVVRRAPFFRRLLGLGLAAVLALVAGVVAADDKPAPQYSEEEVKAGILVGFARTTEWPPGTFKEGPKNFVIGILGRDTLGDKATGVFAAPSSTGQTVEFKVIADVTAARECHVLFIPRVERRRTREIVEGLKHSPVVTVGESEDFLDQDGMVYLVPKEGKMKFEINLNAAKAANLKIPAKVLGTALAVRGKYD